jgi:hypothetical protein
VSAGEWEIEIDVPVGATPAQRSALVQAAIDRKVDGDIDDMLKGFDAFK